MLIFPSILDGNNDHYEWKYFIDEKNDHYEWKKLQLEKMPITNGENNGWGAQERNSVEEKERKEQRCEAKNAKARIRGCRDRRDVQRQIRARQELFRGCRGVGMQKNIEMGEDQTIVFQRAEAK